MSKIKITMSYGDLEKLLLTPEGEIQIEIGHQIANAFAGRYLKSIIHDEVMKKVDKGIQNAVQEALDTIFAGPVYAPRVTERVRKKIQDEVDKDVTECIRSRLSETIKAAATSLEGEWPEERVAAEINRHVDYNIKNRIEQGVNEKIRKALGVK